MTQGEAPHKDLAHHFRRSGNVTLFKAASAARWTWNCEDWWVHCLPEQTLLQCWWDWKSVAKFSWSGIGGKSCFAIAGTVKKRNEVLRLAYRVEPYCLQEWSGLYTDLGPAKIFVRHLHGVPIILNICNFFCEHLLSFGASSLRKIRKQSQRQNSWKNGC